MFYIIIATVLPGVTLIDVENILSTAQAYRIAANAWVINTAEPAVIWHNRLINLVHPSGRLFISRLDISDRFGWMDEAFWTWMNQQAALNAVRKYH